MSCQMGLMTLCILGSTSAYSNSNRRAFVPDAISYVPLAEANNNNQKMVSFHADVAVMLDKTYLQFLQA